MVPGAFLTKQSLLCRFEPLIGTDEVLKHQLIMDTVTASNLLSLTHRVGVSTLFIVGPLVFQRLKFAHPLSIIRWWWLWRYLLFLNHEDPIFQLSLEHFLNVLHLLRGEFCHFLPRCSALWKCAVQLMLSNISLLLKRL